MGVAEMVGHPRDAADYHGFEADGDSIFALVEDHVTASEFASTLFESPLFVDSKPGKDHCHDTEALFRRNKRLHGIIQRLRKRKESRAWEKWQYEAAKLAH